MTTSPIKQCLLREFDSRFSEFGLTRHSYGAAGDLYRRTMAGGSQQISLATHKRGGALEMYSPSISQHVDAVEEFVARFESSGPVPLKPSNIDMRATIGFRAEKWTLIGILEKTWIISDESSAINVVREFVPWVMSKAIPFWERFSDLREVLKILSSNDEEARRLGGPDHFRAEKAVALAILLDGKDAARKLADAKLSVLRDDQRDEFKQWMGRALT